MPLVKAAKPKEIFAPEDWAEITHISPWRGFWLTFHAWAIIALVAGGTTWLWQWNWTAGMVATIPALFLIGGRQLGLSIVMHDAAHGLMHPNRKINNMLGQFAGAATGSDLHAYRAYHLTHHKYTQQPEDPDLSLSAPFPTSPASMRRKVFRDLTAQTFFKQRSHQFTKAWIGLKAILRGDQDAPSTKRDTSAGRALNNSGRTGIDAPVETVDGAKVTAKVVGRFLAIQFGRSDHQPGDARYHSIPALDRGACHHLPAYPAHPQYRRTCLHYHRKRRSLYPCPDHPGKLAGANGGCALLGELPQRASPVHGRALLPPGARASTSGRRRLSRAHDNRTKLCSSTEDGHQLARNKSASFAILVRGCRIENLAIHCNINPGWQRLNSGKSKTNVELCIAVANAGGLQRAG